MHLWKLQINHDIKDNIDNNEVSEKDKKYYENIEDIEGQEFENESCEAISSSRTIQMINHGVNRIDQR